MCVARAFRREEHAKRAEKAHGPSKKVFMIVFFTTYRKDPR